MNGKNNVNVTNVNMFILKIDSYDDNATRRPAEYNTNSVQFYTSPVVALRLEGP